MPLLFAGVVFSSCEENIYPELEYAEPQIVIDAWINNSQAPQYIRIAETLPYFDSVSNAGIRGANVYIIENESNVRYDFEERSAGTYEWIPSPQQPQLGMIMNSYDLYVEVGGKVYTSTSTMNRVPEIDSIVFSYRDESFYEAGYYAQFYARDMVGPGDTYWIKAYKNGDFLNKPVEINLAFDAGFTAGGNIDGAPFVQPIRDMINPFDDDEAGNALPPYAPGDRVRVEIHSITQEAFNYLNELKIQTDRPGGFAELFSVPLSNVPTNIAGTDGEGPEPLGFFCTSAVSSLEKHLD